jgi:hypothetical protein
LPRRHKEERGETSKFKILPLRIHGLSTQGNGSPGVMAKPDERPYNDPYYWAAFILKWHQTIITSLIRWQFIVEALVMAGI